MKNKTIIFEKRPIGKPTVDCFKIIESQVPKPNNGEVLLKTVYVSVDPYLRGRMNNSKSYIAPFNLDEPIKSGIIAEVIESKDDTFSKGDFVNATLDWSEYQTCSSKGLIKVNPDIAPLSSYLGILGMPGLTAFFGLLEIGQPKAGETLVVSGAAGAVGSLVGQIGKLMGCKVIGIAGNDKKTEMLKRDFGFDEAINYKTTRRIYKTISQLCPSGVDIYFDNVGGEISDGIIMNIAKNARIVICGAISLYNETRIPMGPRLQGALLVNSALMKGFIVSDYAKKFPEAIKQLTQWYRDGKIKDKETIVKGFENIPEAFIGLFEGVNTGKMIVSV